MILPSLLTQLFSYKNAMLVFLAFWFSLPLLAQEYVAKVDHYSVEQGLSHRQVNAICQDSRGFVWIGTPNGLNRFDGYTFQQYTKQKDGLFFNNISTIKVDAEGWLWLLESLSNKVCLFHPVLKEVRSLEERLGKTDAEIIGDDLVYGIQRDEEGALWFSLGKAKKLCRYHPATGLQTFSIKTDSKFYLYGFLANKTIWAINEQGTRQLELDQKGNVLRYLDLSLPYQSWVGHAKNGIVLYKQKKNAAWSYFLLTPKGNLQPLNWNLFPKPDPTMLFVWDREGLILTEKGLVDPRRGVIANWEFPYQHPASRVWLGFMEDRSGRIWLGDDFGMYILQVKKSRFKRYFFDEAASQGSGNSVRGILASKGKLYANLEANGFFELDLKTGQNRALLKSKVEWGHFGLAMTKKGEILSGSALEIFRLAPDAGSITSIPTGFKVWSLYEDKRGKCWLGTENGLYTCSPGVTAPESFSLYNDFPELASAFVVHIEQDKAGMLWVCTNNGLYKIDPKKGVLARYWSEGKGEFFLPADNFFHFYTDAEGVFWIATATGLIRTPSKTESKGSLSPVWDEQRSKLFTRANGLSNDVVYAVYEDERGNLWLPSDYGLMRMDKKTGLVKTYLQADGISNNEFNRLSHFKGKDGTLYFGGLNGITAFNPADFYSTPGNKASWSLAVATFQQYDGKTNQLLDRSAELFHTNTIVLRPNDRIFNLEVALLNFEEVNLIQYVWKIEGLDKDWHYQKERQINFGGLPYGTYKLRIKAQAADGQWSGNELVLTIKSLRPWYLQAWFLILAALLLSGGVFLYNRQRIRRHLVEQKRLKTEVEKATERIELDKKTIEKQAEELRHLDEVKSRFFANVSHELRTPLSLLLGPISTILKGNRLANQDFTLLKLAQVHAKQLLQSVNQILDLSKLESGKLELQEAPVLLYPLLRRTTAAFESHAQRQGIGFVFQSKIENTLRLELDVAKLGTILNNLLSNALKFTANGGKIIVSVESLGHSILISVKDTGRGIHPDDLPRIFERFYQTSRPNAPTEGGTGIGLALCRELAELMAGRLWASSEGPQKGSQFYLEFPLKEVFGITEAPELADDVESDLFEALPASATQAGAEAAIILLVEDNPSLRDYLKTILSNNYRVVAVENGQAAMDVLNDVKNVSLPTQASPNHHSALITPNSLPDLIVSDIMMPVMDGFQLLERLKNNDRYRHIPVVMLTARAELEDKLHALRIGVDDYLTKPFEEEELLARVKNLLQNQQNRLPVGIDAETEPEKPSLSQADADWLEKIEAWTLSQLKNDLLSVSEMARMAALSERQLQRRLRDVSGLSPQQYISELRLQAARSALEKGVFRTVAEVAYDAGFNDPKTFSRAYRERFGRLPSTYF